MRGRTAASFALIALAVIGFVAASGKDVNWDALNYHLYGGMQAFDNRLSQDFMGAGLPGYLNPLTHAPFYLMVTANWPPLLIACCFALFHSVNLFLALLIGRRLLADSPAAWQRLGAWLGVGFAALNPILLQTLGSSFNDATVSVFVLGGALAMATYLDRGLLRWSALSACLFGLACGLKLSSVFFALAFTPALLFAATPWARRAAAVAVYALCGLASSLLLMAPWASELWAHHGNPLFPFFNEVFRSPDMLVEPLKHLRFVPQTWVEVLWRPFAMVMPAPLLHTEPISPDARYALLLLLAGLLLGHRLLGHRPFEHRLFGTAWDKRAVATPPTGPVLTGAAGHAAARRLRYALATCFALAWALWLIESGNSRYFLPMGTIAGPLLAAACVRLALKLAPWGLMRLRAGLLGLLALLTLQLALSGTLRWTQLPWGDSWYEVEMPAQLREQPALYLSTSALSASFVAPFLHPQSGLMNISGALVLGPGGPGYDKAQRLIASAGERLRTLTVLDAVYEDGSPVLPGPEALDRVLNRFDLAIDQTHCQLISSAPATLLTIRQRADRQPTAFRPRMWMQSCAVVASPGAFARELARRQAVDEAFEHLERACPRLLQPVGVISEGAGQSWQRIYLNSDASLQTLGSRVTLFQPFRSNEIRDLGSVDEWRRGVGVADCE